MASEDNNFIKNENKMKKEKKNEISTTRKIIIGFFILIVIGTILLSLPIATVSGESDVLTSLFTSTTSVCVTGLVVVDTFSYWTLFGKIIILILIQLGGLGVVALTSSVLIVLHKKVTLRDRMMIQDAYNLNTMQGMVKFIRKIIFGTILVELFGAMMFCISFIPKYGIGRGIWYSVFNSISAFCNAGIDILGPTSLMGYYDSPLVLITTMMLIVLGGIGFVVWWDLIEVGAMVITRKIRLRDFYSKLKIHTKIVVVMTLSLIFSGFVMMFLLECNNPETIGNMSFGNKLLNSMFQSVTLRTAGFASFNQAGLEGTSVLISIVFMIIGGSPVGTAGGIKTVTAVVIIATIVSVTKGERETVVANKTINAFLIRKALSVMMIAFTVFITATILLLATNKYISLEDGMFEVASAIGTVGLSRNITPTLNVAGRIIIILVMFMGRIGPISLFIAFNNKTSAKNQVHYSEADIIVG